MKFENANVLITGGASGIGKIMGRMALEKGARTFIIWDINITNIEATRKELASLGKVKGYAVDVSKPEMVELAYRKTVSDCGNIDILINCAGIITSNKTFCGIPFGFHFIRFWQAILPVKVFDWFFGEVFGIYHAMDNFTGRKPHISNESKAS